MTPETLASAIVCPLARAQKWAAPISGACERYEINTPARTAAFLAQVGNESGRLVYVRELWGPSPSQESYQGRTDLGNLQPGDGFRFRGRGLIQITGRANYRACGHAIGEDFEDRPELLETPTWAAMSAAWFWQSHGCNELADSGDFDHITRVINGGMNGAADRRALWESAKAALGIAA